LLGRQRLRRGQRRLGQLGDVTEPRALAEQPLLGAGLHALGALRQLAQLRQTLGTAGGGAGELVAPAPRGDELAPSARELRPAGKLLLPDECVEDVELVRAACQAPLLELA
jgi:hypothetical protein